MYGGTLDLIPLQTEKCHILSIPAPNIIRSPVISKTRKELGN